MTQNFLTSPAGLAFPVYPRIFWGRSRRTLFANSVILYPVKQAAISAILYDVSMHFGLSRDFQKLRVFGEEESNEIHPGPF